MQWVRSLYQANLYLNLNSNLVFSIKFVFIKETSIYIGILKAIKRRRALWVVLICKSSMFTAWIETFDLKYSRCLWLVKISKYNVDIHYDRSEPLQSNYRNYNHKLEGEKFQCPVPDVVAGGEPPLSPLLPPADLHQVLPVLRLPLRAGGRRRAAGTLSRLAPSSHHVPRPVSVWRLYDDHPQ